MIHSVKEPQSKGSSPRINRMLFFGTVLSLVIIYVAVAEFNLSMFFLEHGAFDQSNVFFDSDPNRITIVRLVLRKISLIHPLISVMLFPILKAIQYMHPVSFAERVIILTTIVGVISVLQFYLFTTLIFKEPPFSFGMAILFAFSFSTVIFTVVPESYIFAQASLGLMYLVFFLCYYEKRWQTKTKFILIVLTGIIVAGITITNIVTFLITLIVFEISVGNSTPRKSFFRVFSIANLVIGLVLGLFFLQFFVAPIVCNPCSKLSISPISSYIGKLTRHANDFTVEEQAGFSRQFNGLPSTIKNMFFPTIPVSDFRSRFSFNETNYGINNFANFLFALFVLGLILLGKDLKRKPLWLSLFLSLAFNLVFHVFFGMDFFLYTQHFTFQIFALLSFSLINFYKRRPIVFGVLLFSLIILEFLSTVKVLRFLQSNY